MIDFVSPHSQKALHLQAGEMVGENGEKFPVINNIPRFVAADNYAAAFGHQWKKFAKTQLDSFNGHTISRDRLVRCLGMPLENLKGKNVLEMGGGAGRFTELLVKSGAYVHSVDLSNAVEVNKENVGNAENYRVAQASVYELPFPKQSFDVVICLGVIQHTPSSEKTISALWEMVKPGGLLVIDHYIWRLSYYFNPATYWRLVLKEMKPQTSMKLVNGAVNFFFPMQWAMRNSRLLTWLLHRVSPVMTYFKALPQLNKEEQFDLARLDSYDSLTDYYKHLKTPAQMEVIFRNLKGENIWINKGGNGVEARCIKPLAG